MTFYSALLTFLRRHCDLLQYAVHTVKEAL